MNLKKDYPPFQVLRREREDALLSLAKNLISFQEPDFCYRLEANFLKESGSNCITVTAVPFGTISSLKKIIFSWELQEKNVILVTFIVEVNNQKALWAHRAGAHTAEVKFSFDNLTEETIEGLGDYIRRYTKETEGLIDIFSFEEKRELSNA